jgi:DNA polymerase-3 subunit delta
MSETNTVYLLQGPEEGEKIAYIDKIIKTICSQNSEEPEIFRYYSFETDIIDVTSLLCNGSLFNNHTVVILNNTEEIKKADDLTLLCEYIVSPSSSATLILTTPTVRQVSKKIIDKIPEKNNIIFWEMFENQRKGWLTNFFRNHDIKIRPDALDFFLEMAQNNTQDLKHECNKFVLFFGAGSTITVEDLEKYLYHSKEENVFTLFERFAEKDFSASLEVLQKILSSGESDAIAVLSGLLWQVKKLLQIKLLLSRNYHIDELYTKLGIISKKNQKMYLEANKNYSFSEVKSIIVLLTEFDIRIRSYRSDLHLVLLQLFFYYAIKTHGNVPDVVSLYKI